MKKTLQRELRVPAQSVDGTNTAEPDSLTQAAVLTPSSSKHLQQKQHQQSVTNHRMTTDDDDDDVSFKYLKHVLIKFLTSREYEVQFVTFFCYEYTGLFEMIVGVLTTTRLATSFSRCNPM